MRLKILHDGGTGKVRSWLMPPVSSVLENCVVGKEGGGMKASPSAACVRDANHDGLVELASFRKSSAIMITCISP